MGAKVISNRLVSPTISLTECARTADYPQGFWLYDNTRGMNLSMGAATEEAAFIEAITYYQKNMARLEAWYKQLNDKVEAFVDQIRPEQDN